LDSGVVQLTQLRSKIWGGELAASGRYDIAGGKAEGKASLRRVSLAAVPWDALASPVRLAGTGDLSILVAGGAGRLRGSVSLSLPEGLERLPASGEDRFLLRVPLTAEAAGELREGREVRIDSLRFRAGEAETRGEGTVSLAERAVRMRGTVAVPAGKAADYGWGYPLSWGKAEGSWELSGPATALHVAADLQVDSLAVRSLPPLPLRLKAEGQPAREMRFVADVPGRAFRVTAKGTVVSLLAPSRARAEIAVAARDVDLSEGARWATAVAASLGQPAGDVPRYLAGAEGVGEGDVRVTVGEGGAIALTGVARSRALGVRGVPLRDLKVEGEFDTSKGPARWAARGSCAFGDGALRFEAHRAEPGYMEFAGSVDRLEIAQALSLLRQGNQAGLRGILKARLDAREGPGGWEVPVLVAETKELALGEMKFADVRLEGKLGGTDGKFNASSSSPRIAVDGEVRREPGWPVTFRVAAVDVPTAFLLAAAGRGESPSGGTWNADGGGVIRLGDLLGGKGVSGEAFPALHATVRSGAPSVGEVRFEDFRVSGSRQGESIRGEIEARFPATRLAWSVNLREPFGFRVEGPFSLGEAETAAPKDGKRRFSLQGRAEVEGSLRALEKTSGTVTVETVRYREGGQEFAGTNLSARMDPEGIRWTGGTIVAAGNPLKVSGKVSWKGDLDVRLDGKVPASVLRLVVPGLFERLDGVLTVGVRLAGKWDDPTIVGTGHAEGATLSFAGYGQVFEAIRADAVISREKIIFEHFEGRTGGGYFDGRGEVPLQMDAGQRMYFSVDFMDVRYPYPDDFHPVVQGHAELIGPLEDLLVTGEVEVQSARYTRNQYPERALVDFSKRLADVAARREKTDFRVRLDINVVADRTIRLKNNLADARASGEFKIAGDSSRVILLGSFDVYEGYVEYYGSRYELKRVVVDFQDPRRNNPRLDARAETKKGNYNVTVSVSGTFEKPEVDFASDPPLSRTDIVSLLSFGVTTQNLGSSGTGSGGSSGAVGAAAVVVGTYVGGVDETIRGAVGLDRFSIETGFSQATKQFEPRFVVGKSFGDRATVSVSTSVGTSAETSASGELKIRENLYLQGAWESTTGSTRGDVSGDLKVKYRFRQFKDLLRGGE
jgi:autotransporter translocation and assembly factor TamB